jgi:hypothetical protein
MTDRIPIAREGGCRRACARSAVVPSARGFVVGARTPIRQPSSRSTRAPAVSLSFRRPASGRRRTARSRSRPALGAPHGSANDDGHDAVAYRRPHGRAPCSGPRRTRTLPAYIVCDLGRSSSAVTKPAHAMLRYRNERERLGPCGRAPRCQSSLTACGGAAYLVPRRLSTATASRPCGIRRTRPAVLGRSILRAANDGALRGLVSTLPFQGVIRAEALQMSEARFPLVSRRARGYRAGRLQTRRHTRRATTRRPPGRGHRWSSRPGRRLRACLSLRGAKTVIAR